MAQVGPIPLISPVLVPDGGEVLSVNEAALHILEKIDIPVVRLTTFVITVQQQVIAFHTQQTVLVVSGLYRTGKSSLLNWICGNDSTGSGFRSVELARTKSN